MSDFLPRLLDNDSIDLTQMEVKLMSGMRSFPVHLHKHHFPPGTSEERMIEATFHETRNAVAQEIAGKLMAKNFDRPDETFRSTVFVLSYNEMMSVVDEIRKLRKHFHQRIHLPKVGT